ncbi:MAG: EFR1 family ferrodoxin [Bacteroidales bacterium]
MQINHISTVYFSPTMTTRKIVNKISGLIAVNFNVSRDQISISTPKDRKKPLVFKKGELVVFGLPVYGGRIPSLLIDYLNTIEGNGALCVPVCVYGNRSVGDALSEHCGIMKKMGLNCIAAGSFVAEHSFSSEIATGRPDMDDVQFCAKFSKAIIDKIEKTDSIKDFKPFTTPGKSYKEIQEDDAKAAEAAKDTPKAAAKKKVVPVTDDLCSYCGYCINICPTGAINPKNPKDIIGDCIHCYACIRYCPSHSKSFADPEYNAHIKDIIKYCNAPGYSKPEFYI